MRFFIADDLFLIREGFKQALKEIPNAEFCGESNSLENIGALLKTANADVLVMDMNLCSTPLKGMVDTLKRIKPELGIVIFSNGKCELPVLSAINAGVKGFIQKKNLEREELFSALSILASGKEYYSQEITRILIGTYNSDGIRKFNFSQREIEILQYITHGRSNEQIAEILFLSENTVATHRRNIMRKAGVNKTTELIIWAKENNFQI